MGMNRIIGSAVWLFVIEIGGAVDLHAQEELNGDIACHDPSTIIEDGNTRFFFKTGAGIPYHWSTDLRDWSYGGRIFPDGPPAWVDAAVQDYDPNNWNWAPDVAYFNGQYHVYYSVSEWGGPDSVIGLVTSPSLISPIWTDQGKVVQSDRWWEAVSDTDTTVYNCIDPSILVDTNGSVWMAFGSWSGGIAVTEIDPATGLRMNTNTLDETFIADNPALNGIEGACIYQHNGYYYLFVNYHKCCSGVDSTYNIRVGRSLSVTGPYFDKDGVDMRYGGGTMLLESSGRFVGPGHAAIYDDGDSEWFSYHYYTWPEFGSTSELGLSRLSWDEYDWPVLPNDWSALYPFNADAHEQMGFYDGTFSNGASVVSDDLLSKALELDGSGAFVQLHAAVANCKTVVTWVKWNGGADWQRIFDFGTDTTNYMFLTPRSNSGTMRFGIKNGGGEQTLDAPFALPTNTWCHVAVTLDGEQGILYFNGNPVATNTVTIRPWEVLARNNYIGKSQFSTDPGFSGRIASFRVFAHALSADEVRAIAEAPPSLAHRYSFTTDVHDSIGMANGRLEGGALITNGLLHLPGTSGSYAQLPGGLVSGSRAVTIEYWADLSANADWARVFDFGNIGGAYGANYLFFTPHSSFSDYRLDLNGTVLAKPGGNLNNQSAHVVCIVDPPSNYTAIYVNGQLVNQQTASTSSLSTIGKEWSFLGRSLFSADPYLNGDIDEFRIYEGRLTAQEIAGNYAHGPDEIYQPTFYTWANDADNMTFKWSSYPAGYAIEYSSTLTDPSWTTLTAPIPENGTNTLLVPVDSNAFFRLRR